MAHIVDTRSAGGEFVVLGDSLTLPTSSNATNPSQGSLRFNPITQAIEFYNTTGSGWTIIGNSASGNFTSSNYVPLIGNSVISGNITVNGYLNVTGGIYGGSISNSAGNSSVIPFNISSYLVQANGTTTTRTLGTRFGESLNLKDFGATGNGTTDDTVAVNMWWAAIVATGLPGIVPAGTYLISSMLIFDMGNRQSGITIIGAGNNLSIFNLNAVSVTPAALITCSLGGTTHNKIIGISFSGNIAGTVLQIGASNLSDPMDNSELAINVFNSSVSVSATSAVLNYIRSSKITMNAACASHGQAAKMVALCYCDIFGSFTDADIGIHLTSGASFGNVFNAVSALRVGSCVTIDSVTASQNTFMGGSFGWTLNSINATAGTNNVFFNVNYQATNALAGTVGIFINNGSNASNAITSLGYTPLNSAGDTMIGDLIISNNDAIRFSNLQSNTTTRLVFDNNDILSLYMTDGSGNQRTVFSIGQGGNTSLTFGVPVTTNINGIATSATKLVTPVTLAVSGDAVGSATFDGSNPNVSLNVTLTPTLKPVVATYNQVAVDATGRIVSGALIAYSNGTSNAISSISLTGDVTGTGTGVVNTTLAATGVVAGTYSVVTVDAKGRILNGISSNNTISPLGGTFLSSITFNGSGAPIAIKFMDTVNNANTGLAFNVGNVLNLQTSDGAGGTRQVLSVQANSLNSPVNIYANTVISGTLTATGGFTGNAFTATKFLNNMTLTATGQVTGAVSFNGSNNVSIALSLATNGVSAGTYTNVIVDSTGRVTGGANATTSYVSKTGDTMTGTLSFATNASVVLASVGLDSSGNFTLASTDSSLNSRPFLSILSSSSNSILRALAPVEVVSSAGNAFEIMMDDTNHNATLTASGNANSVGIVYSTQNSGFHTFAVNGSNQAKIIGVANTVNQVELSGGIAGQPVAILANGTDANIGINFTPQGTGNVMWNGSILATIAYVNSISNSTYTIVANTSQISSFSIYPVGTKAYATDGRKPTEFYYEFDARYPDLSTTGSGVPVVYGNTAYSNTNTNVWYSTLDGLQVSS
jgi:hypothetical protein